MKPFRWSPEKNAQLKIERGISFDRASEFEWSGALVVSVWVCGETPAPAGLAHAPRSVAQLTFQDVIGTPIGVGPTVATRSSQLRTIATKARAIRGSNSIPERSSTYLSARSDSHAAR